MGSTITTTNSKQIGGSERQTWTTDNYGNAVLVGGYNPYADKVSGKGRNRNRHINTVKNEELRNQRLQEDRIKQELEKLRQKEITAKQKAEAIARVKHAKQELASSLKRVKSYNYIQTLAKKYDIKSTDLQEMYDKVNKAQREEWINKNKAPVYANLRKRQTISRISSIIDKIAEKNKKIPKETYEQNKAKLEKTLDITNPILKKHLDKSEKKDDKTLQIPRVIQAPETTYNIDDTKTQQKIISNSVTPMKSYIALNVGVNPEIKKIKEKTLNYMSDIISKGEVKNFDDLISERVMPRSQDAVRQILDIPKNTWNALPWNYKEAVSQVVFLELGTLAGNYIVGPTLSYIYAPIQQAKAGLFKGITKLATKPLNNKVIPTRVLGNIVRGGLKGVEYFPEAYLFWKSKDELNKPFVENNAFGIGLVMGTYGWNPIYSLKGLTTSIPQAKARKLGEKHYENVRKFMNSLRTRHVQIVEPSLIPYESRSGIVEYLTTNKGKYITSYTGHRGETPKPILRKGELYTRALSDAHGPESTYVPNLNKGVEGYYATPKTGKVPESGQYFTKPSLWDRLILRHKQAKKDFSWSPKESINPKTGRKEISIKDKIKLLSHILTADYTPGRITGQKVKVQKNIDIEKGKEWNLEQAYLESLQTGEPIATIAPKTYVKHGEPEKEIYIVSARKIKGVVSKLIGYSRKGTPIYDITIKNTITGKPTPKPKTERHFIDTLFTEKKNILEDIYAKQQRKLQEMYDIKPSYDASAHGPHGKPHMEQVFKNLMRNTKLRQKYTADELYATAILHDISKPGDPETEPYTHAYTTYKAIKAGKFDKTLLKDISQSKKNAIAKAILRHTKITPFNYIRRNDLSAALATADRIDLVRFGVAPKRRLMFKPERFFNENPGAKETINKKNIEINQRLTEPIKLKYAKPQEKLPKTQKTQYYNYKDYKSPYNLYKAGYGYSKPYENKYTPEYIPTYTPQYTPEYVPTYTPQYTPQYVPTYVPEYTPPYKPNYEPEYSRYYSTTYKPYYKPTYTPTYTPPYTPVYTPGYTPHKITTIVPTLKTGSIKPTTTSYAVIVRDYDQKGHRTDKQVFAGKTLKDAVGYGSEYVDENPETSFIIKPSRMIGKPYFGPPKQYKFTKHNNRWYEKPQYRQDSTTEKQYINMRRKRQSVY